MPEKESRVLALLNKVAEEQNLQNYDIQLKTTSSEGANYTSTLHVASITSKNKDDLHLFIKVAALGKNLRSDSSFKIYEVENFCYTDLQQLFRELEEKHNLAESDRLKMPKYYAASTNYMEEVIVLENLTKKGFVCHDRMKSVDWECAERAITELTKLHSLSMAFQQENPKGFNRTKKFLDYGGMTDNKGMHVFWNGSKQTAIKEVREKNREKLKKFLDPIDLAAFWNIYTPLKAEVFLHADFRPSNLMYCRREDGTVEVIAVDYQTLRGGCPVVDLLYFIFTGTDSQFRKQYYTKLINHYYEQLAAALTRLGMNPEEKYSREDFEFELKEKLPFGLAVAVFTLPIVTVESENAPKVDEKMELSDFSIQKTGSLFPERLNGIVDDFVSWGVI